MWSLLSILFNVLIIIIIFSLMLSRAVCVYVVYSFGLKTNFLKKN